ncbi:recombinase family protein [Kitasatospora kifunensis]|uniref:recombinase family protein n=1 Tax=Kitasatospora kifunensis TaxID=58351 RepID=UPI0028ABB864|nr:recombinase family protein [Kitasatospora kifunensis]
MPTHAHRHARVSTADQNPDHQIDALLRAGVDRDHVHVDTASGAKASRPKLDLVMQLLREGDTLKVTRVRSSSIPNHRSPPGWSATATVPASRS